MNLRLIDRGSFISSMMINWQRVWNACCIIHVPNCVREKERGVRKGSWQKVSIMGKDKKTKEERIEGESGIVVLVWCGYVIVAWRVFLFFLSMWEGDKCIADRVALSGTCSQSLWLLPPPLALACCFFIILRRFLCSYANLYCLSLSLFLWPIITSTLHSFCTFCSQHI